MHDIIVRAETAEDLRAIDVVNLSAFEGEAEAKLVAALRQRAEYKSSMSLVAEFNGRIVGHTLLTNVPLRQSTRETEVIALAPMAVVPSQSHRGIGARLLEAAIAKAREGGSGALVVAGEPEYYLRFGFLPAAQWHLQCNLPVPEAALTAMELQPGALNEGGNIIYPQAFIDLFAARTP